MANVPLSEICLCGIAHWQMMMQGVVWCRRCGCVRMAHERYWRVPLDRADELNHVVILPDEDEVPTQPGTPEAKRVEDD